MGEGTGTVRRASGRRGGAENWCIEDAASMAEAVEGRTIGEPVRTGTTTAFSYNPAGHLSAVRNGSGSPAEQS